MHEGQATDIDRILEKRQNAALWNMSIILAALTDNSVGRRQLRQFRPRSLFALFCRTSEMEFHDSARFSGKNIDAAHFM